MKRKGISLITLVITIVIVIILAGAVILNLSDKNPIKDATKAVVIEDIDTFRTELMLKLTTASIFDTENINAVTKDDILKYIPSMENRKVGSTLYTDILVVSEGKLKVDGTKANEAMENKKLTQEQYDWIVEALVGSVFNAQTYSIKYYLNDGTDSFTESSKIHNVKYSILSSSVEREGYGFTGWNTASDGTGTAYNAGDEYTENAELTLYAQWNIITYEITYNANNGVGAPSSQTKNYGQELTLSMSEPTRSGYAFCGWNTKSDGTGTNYAVGASYTANENVTLYAKWVMPISATQVKASPSTYYGAYVNYTPSNGCTVKWRVFYSDNTNIYLIADDYVPNSYLKDTGLAADGDYCVCCHAYGSGGRENVLTALTTSSYYADFKDSAGKASSVVGAPTLEMYKNSYNSVNTDASKQMDILNCTAGQSVTGIGPVANNGYVLRFGNTGNYEYYITKMPTDANKRDLYIITSTTKADKMWIADFTAADEDSAGHGKMMYALGGDSLLQLVQENPMNDFSKNGGVSFVQLVSSPVNYTSDSCAMRPLVTLDSNVKLVDLNGDGVYDLQ